MNGHFIGFSANPQNPFDYGASRNPPTFEFPKDATRVVLSTAYTSSLANSPNPTSGTACNYNLYYYYPPNGKIPSSSQPYVYFKPVIITSGQPPVYVFKIDTTTAGAWTTWQTSKYGSTFVPGGPTSPAPTPSNANQAATSTQPYLDSTTSSTSRAFVNTTSYQLLCPGVDGKYGNYSLNTTSGSTACPLYPSGGTDAVNGIDDMTNFTKGPTVGDDTH